MKTGLRGQAGFRERSLGRIRGVLLGAGLIIATIASGQSAAPSRDADACWHSAWNFLQLAEVSNALPAEAKFNLGKALEQCDAALKIQPDFFRAAALAAHCSYRLAQIERNPRQQGEAIQSARKRFESAGSCTGANAALFREWGGMLMFESDLPENARNRTVLLREAQRAYESGIRLSNYSGERAKLEGDLGTCLVLLAPQAGNPEARLAMYEQAIHHFESTTNVEIVAASPQVCARWGIALVECAKLTYDFSLLRLAIERLGTALEGDPKNLEARYNLICAYALFDDPVNALRHLRICLENDDAKHTYYNTAAQDPDLDALRKTREYNEIFGEKPKADLPLIPPPKISN